MRHTEVVPFCCTSEFHTSAVKMGSVPLAEQQSLSIFMALTTGTGSGSIIFGKANINRNQLIILGEGDLPLLWILYYSAL